MLHDAPGSRKLSPGQRILRVMVRLGRERRSETAVEFALIGTAFFLFIFGMFVVALDQFMQMTLDDSVRDAARQVANNQAKTGTAFVSDVCNEFGALAPGCTAKLQYDLQQGAYFGAITPATLGSAGLSTTAGFPATLIGSACSTAPLPEFMLAQVAYPVPFRIPLLPTGTATQNGTPYVYSVVAAEIEPCTGT